MLTTTRKLVDLLTVVSLLLLSSLPLWGQPQASSSEAASSAAAPEIPASQPQARFHASLPLQFEPNQGQLDVNVQFMARTSALALYLTQNEAVFVTRPKSTTDHRAHLRPDKLHEEREKTADTDSQTPLVVRMKLNGSNLLAQAQGEERLPGTVNYFIGNDPAKWRRQIPTYSKVRYTNVYEGIDLVYHSSGQNLEYDFELGPHADPQSIEMAFEGVDSIEFDRSGEITMKTGSSTFMLHKPTVYQMEAGQRKYVQGDFEFRGARKVGLRLKNYDPSKSTVIDPVLVYSSYLGGSGDDWASGIALDSVGNIYLAGGTSSANFPKTGTATPPSGTCVAFVTKLDPTATSILYSSFIGGTHGDNTCSWGDFANGIVVDASGRAYIAGPTLSHDFPVTIINALQPLMMDSASSNAFLSKLSPDGESLLYSTFLGGENNDAAYSVAVDANQNAYLAGWAISADFPVTSSAFQNSRTSSSTSGNGFVSRIDTTQAGASSLIYSSYLGGSGAWGDAIYKIAVDSLQNAYLAGWTSSADFPVTTATAFQPTASIGQWCGFLSRVNTSLSGPSSLAYSSFLCGSYSDWPAGIALDTNVPANTYVSSEVWSLDFPTTGLGPSNARYPNAAMEAITKVNTFASGSASLVYSRLLGGSDPSLTNFGELAWGIGVDPNGNAYLSGQSSSSDYPVTVDAAQSTLKSSSGNGVLSVLSPDGSTLLYSTYLGGSGTAGGDYISAVALDSSFNVWLAGATDSTNFPTTTGAIQATYGENGDAFIAELSALPVPHILAVSPTTAIAGSVVTINGSNLGDPRSVTFGGVQASVQSWNSTSIAVQVPRSLSPGAAPVVVTTELEPANVVNFTVISTPLAITAPTTNGQVGVAYVASIAATGGIAPYSWSISSGTLPTGLFLDSTTGQIRGTPASSGTFSFTVQATDSSTPPKTALQSFTIILIPGSVNPTITPSTTNAAVLPGQPAVFDLRFQGGAGDANAVFNIACEDLPRDLSCSYSPSPFRLDTNGVGTATVTIMMTRSTAAASSTKKGFLILAFFLTPPLAGMFLMGSFRKQRWSLLPLLLVLLGASGCGTNISTSAPAGTSTIRLVATSQHPALLSVVTMQVRVGTAQQ